jgi:hypothetical protein
MLDKTTFKDWLSEFFMQKSNELQYSKESQPKRMEKITVDLSASTVNPVQINVPFKSMIISRVYSTASPTIDKSGSIFVLFDQDNLANIKNAVSLFPNDTLRSGTLVSKCFLTWTAQADTSMDIYFYPDIEVVAGTTKTQIVGAVSVQNTNATSIYSKPTIPSLITRLNSAGTTSYSVRTGFYAMVTFCIASNSAGTNTVSIGGSVVANDIFASTVSGWAMALAGEAVVVAGATANTYAQVMEYPI